MILDALNMHRSEILDWEICCLLHDIGKLSDEFLFYRQNWHRMREGYSKKDPHEDNWFKKKDDVLQKFDKLRQFFETPLIPATKHQIEGVLSIEHAVHEHTKHDVDSLINLLKIADSADSEYDRNDPLIGCEQTDHANNDHRPEVYRSNVFGYEGEDRKVYCGEFETPNGIDNDPQRKTDGVLTRAREEFYRKLQDIVSPLMARQPFRFESHQEYYSMRDLMKEYFEPAMSDTTRPNNDTSLWEHVYSVASIAKALHIHTLMGGQIDSKQLFRIWGFGFDSMRFLSQSHKIGDLLGRRSVLDDIFKRVQQWIEFEIPFGNCVYKDDSSVFFLAPPLEEAVFQKAQEELRGKIITISLELSGGEVVPRFTFGKRVRALTRIVEQVQQLRNLTAIPVSEGSRKLAQAIREQWHDRQVSICPVCRTRPTLTEKDNKLLCATCRDWRQGHTEGFSLEPRVFETPMIEEIADSNGRVAMIVAKFGLREWLDGTMIRTCLIKQPDAIKKTMDVFALVKEKSLRGDMAEKRNWFQARESYRYQNMLEDFENCRNGSTESLFLFGRGISDGRLNQNSKLTNETWNLTVEDAEEEHQHLKGRIDNQVLLNLVCAKTPTPSTVLDVWETTAEFFDRFTKPYIVFGQDKSDPVFTKREPLLIRNKADGALGKASARWYVEVESLPDGLKLGNHQTFEAEIDRVECEVVYEGKENRFWLVRKKADEAWRGKYLVVKGQGDKQFSCKISHISSKRDAYYRFRCISTSPDLLLLLVPADKCLEVTKAIYERYLDEFGKAYGRLPLCIGNIIFQKFLPMFSVLDAVRRMEASFRRLQEGPWVQTEVPLDSSELNLELGPQQGGSPEVVRDWHHPYIPTIEPLCGATSFFQTLVGPVAHIKDIPKNKRVCIRPNYYDSEFLGASAHRFRLHLRTDWQEPDPKLVRQEMSIQEFRQRIDRGDPDELGTGPILLEELLREETEGSIAQIWKVIKESHISSSSLRNLEQALISRYVSWGAGRESQAADALLVLGSSLAEKYFPNPEHKKVILKGIENSLFFRTVNLYLRILKRDLEQGDRDVNRDRRSETLSPVHVSR